MSGDAPPFQWGRPPLPLLPRGLRTLWARERLPDWVTDELGLPPGATFMALGPDVWTTSTTDRISGPLRKYLTDRINFRSSELREVALLGVVWPRQLDPRRFPWSARVRKCLSQADLIDQPDRLARASAWDLLRYRNIGAVSILEFAGVVEVVLSAHATRPTGVTVA